MRATVLTRLASGRRSRSVDAADEADSPSSIYSQASAAPSAYRSSVDFTTAFISEAVPPVPSIPTQYQSQKVGLVGWQQESLPQITTTSPEAQPVAKTKLSSPLEDSHAFPLPVASDIEAPKTPSAQWFSTLWPQSPNSTSPSPSHSPSDRIVIRSSVSEVPSVRSLEVSHSMPQYNVGSQEEAHQGTVGYQLPPNWRAGQVAMVMPTPQMYGDNTPRASWAAVVHHA